MNAANMSLDFGPATNSTSNRSTPTFDVFLKKNKALIRKIATIGRLEFDDAEQSVWMAWHTAQEKWDAKHESAASFNSYCISIFVGAVKKELTSRGDYKNTAAIEDLPEWIEIAAASVEEKDIQERVAIDNSFEDALMAHPIYQHKVYKLIIDGILAQKDPQLIADDAGVSLRRVYQALQEINVIFNRNDPILDDQLIKTKTANKGKGTNSLDADVVKVISISDIDADGKNISEDELMQMVLSIHDAGVMSPITLDQFNRVLDGEKRIAACKILGIKNIRTVKYVIKNAKSDNDDAFKKARKLLKNTNTESDCLVSAFSKMVRQGCMSQIVAKRIGRLSNDEQNLVYKTFGPLCSSINFTDADLLVRASTIGKLAEKIDGMRNQVKARLLKSLEA